MSSDVFAVTSALQQQHAIHARPHLRVGKRKALHFLAGHAPVGVEIEHHRPAARLRELLLELGQ